MYVYVKDLEGDYRVGFYDPFGEFVTENVFKSIEDAAYRASWLNGHDLTCPRCKIAQNQIIYSDRPSES